MAIGRMDGRKPIIEFRDFGFQYKARGEPTLFNINLTVYEGEKILITGASGSGKSTLANCVNGLIPFSYDGTITGSLKVAGEETRGLSVFKLSNAVGTVLQDSDAQFVGLSVGEDIAFAMENDETQRAEMLPRVLGQSARVNMQDYLDALPFYLSGGQKQKVALAGVLDERTKIIIFDEPLASLDPYTGTVAIDLIDRIARGGGQTVVIIEHRLEDVLYRPIDRVVVMDGGRIVSDSTPGELLRSNTLREYGIREPLYIAALRYAGCDLNQIDNLEDPNNLVLSDIDKSKMLAFYGTDAGYSRPETGGEALRLENVSFSYGRKPEDERAVRDVSFSINKGERIALIGNNGAGKSTLARLICGISRPSSGAIFIGGRDAAGMSVREIGGEVGYVMQNPNQMLVKDIIAEEVGLALKLRDIPDAEARRRAEQTMRICEIYRMRNWPVDAVSYGQKKRVTIASILALEPEIVILDEPTAGQDHRHYTDIINFINKLNSEYARTIVFITHDMHLAIENTDRAVVLSEGELIADDSVYSVLSDDAVIAKANLKQTSLYIVAKKLGLPPERFIESYISRERAARGANDPAPHEAAKGGGAASPQTGANE